MAKVIDSKIPAGPVPEKWKEYKAHQRLVNPKNKLKLDVIVVGTGRAGASAAASLGEMGFNVINLCIQDSPRRAHSIAAQGGINAAKCYQNDGDSIYRLFVAPDIRWLLDGSASHATCRDATCRFC